MKASAARLVVLPVCWLVIVFGLASPLLARAGQVTAYDLFKARFYYQTGTQQPLTPTNYIFHTRIFLDGPLTTAQALLFLPSATTGRSMGTSGAYYELREDFVNAPDLDIAYPHGRYTYTLNSPQLTPVTAQTAVLDIPNDGGKFTNTPYFTNFAAIQNLDPTKPFTFSWNPMVFQPSPYLSQIFMVVYDEDAGTRPVDAFIADGSVTSYNVAANVLQPGRRYRAIIYFSIRNPMAGQGFANKNGLLAYDTATSVFFSTQPAKGDFNGDARPDYVLLNSSTSNTTIWHMNGPTYVDAVNAPKLSAGWIISGVGDFNGDGRTDYRVFNPSTGHTAFWYLDGAFYAGHVYGRKLPAGWVLAAVGDFNRDGKLDDVLYNPSTQGTTIWYLNGATYTGSVSGPALPAGWSIVSTADFNGDGKPDYVLYNAGTRQSAIWYLDGVNRTGIANGPTAPSGYSLQGVADFNANGKPDYVLFNSSTRRTVIWHLNGAAYAGAAYGPTLPSGVILASP